MEKPFSYVRRSLPLESKQVPLPCLGQATTAIYERPKKTQSRDVTAPSRKLPLILASQIIKPG